MRLEDINLRNPITVGYYDPFSVFGSIEEDLVSKFPLSNLHWKYHPLKPVKSIPLLPVKLKEEVPSSRTSKRNSRELFLVDNVYLRLIFIQASDLETYRSQVRPLISAWLTDLVKPEDVRWAIVLVVPGFKKEKASTLIKTSLYDKLHIDFGKNGKQLAHLHMALQDDDSDDVETTEHIFRLRDSYKDHIDKLEAYTDMIGHVKALLLQTFDRRYLAYTDKIEQFKPASKENPDLQISEFAEKLKLAQVLNDMRFLQESLDIYEELHRDLMTIAATSAHAFETKELVLPQDLNDYSPEATINSDGLMRQFANYLENNVPISLFQARFGIFLKLSTLLQSLANFATSISVSSFYVSSLLQKLISFINGLSRVFPESQKLNEWFCVVIDFYVRLPLTEKLIELNEKAQETTQANHIAEISEYTAEIKLLKRELVTKLARAKGLVQPEISVLLEEISLEDKSSGVLASHDLTYEPLKEILKDQELYEECFQEITVSAIQDFANCERSKTIDLLSVDLATLHFKRGEYQDALEILQNSYDYYLQNGWGFMGATFLELYLECVSKLESQDHQHIVSMGLKLFAALKHDEGVVAGINSYSLVKSDNQKTRLYKSICENSKKASRQISFPLAELFSFTFEPFIEVNADLTYCLKMNIVNRFGIDLSLLNVEAVLKDKKNHDIRLNFRSGEISIKPQSNTITLATNSFREGDYVLSGITIQATENLSYVDGDVELPVNSADSTVIHHQKDQTLDDESRRRETVQTFHLYHVPGTFHLELARPEAIELDTSALRCKIHGANFPIKMVSVELSTPNEGVTFLQESNLIRADRLDTHATVTSNVRFTCFGENKQVVLRAECVYQNEQGELFYYTATESYDLSLAVSISVQDIFRSNSIFSKFQIGAADAKLPVRVIKWDFKCPNNKYDILSLLQTIDTEDSLLVFGEQPAYLFYKIVPKDNEGSPLDTLDLNITFSSLQTECERLAFGALEEKLEEIGASKFLFLIAPALSLLHFNLNYYGIHDKVLVSNLDECVKFTESRLQRCIATSEVARLTLALSSLFNENELVTGNAVSIEPHVLYIPVGVPTLKMLHQVELKFDKKAQYVASEPIEATLVIESTSKWAGEKLEANLATSSPTQKRRPPKQQFEVTIHSDDSWIITGFRRMTFEVEEHSTVSYSVYLVPITVGDIPLPKIMVKPVSGSEHAMDVVQENGLETVLVVPELDSITFSF